MLQGFRFFSPYWFVLLAPALVALYLAFHRRRRPTALFSSVIDLKQVPITTAQRLRAFLPVVYGAGLLFLITAMARPQWGKTEARVLSDGIAIEMVLDVSGSMEALDFQIDDERLSRIKAVKYVVRQFVEGSSASGLAGRPNDLIGLVAFGGFADSKCPLTLDHSAFLDVMQALTVPKPVRDRRGQILNLEALREELSTAIGDGLSLAVERLKNAPAKSKVIILLTDGSSNAGVIQPREAAQLAKSLGIKTYCIGIGRDGLVPFPMEDIFGNITEEPQRFPIDEELLKNIADTTGGKYFHASNTDGLAQVYAEIDKMERTKIEQVPYTEYREMYPACVAVGLVLIGLVWVLNQTRFRTLP